MRWQDALRETLSAYKGTAHQWGSADCCQFVREYVRGVTGRDYGDAFEYTNRAGALRLIVAHGGMAGLLRHVLGEPDTTGRPGDVVVWTDDDGQEIPGICVGPYSWAFLDDGLYRVVDRIVAAWRVR